MQKVMNNIKKEQSNLIAGTSGNVKLIIVSPVLKKEMIGLHLQQRKTKPTGIQLHLDLNKVDFMCTFSFMES